MSVTIADLLTLPSLRGAKVLGGARGLTKIVSSISVLESTDPDVLIDGLFPNHEFYGSEIVITGFLNAQNDVDCQCANIRRLAEGGEVGLILFYVGIFLQKVDQKLIDLADELDFVLISMPEGQRLLRYSEVLHDVMECIYRDRTNNTSIVSELLERVSRLPVHQQSINTVLKMLSDRISASVILMDSNHEILNLIAWPRIIEDVIKEGLSSLFKYPKEQTEMSCSFLPNGHMYRYCLNADTDRKMELILIKEGAAISPLLLEQVTDIVRISINIWGSRHGDVAIHELVRAILQDEPLNMRRLAELFSIDVASIHEMWILHSQREDFSQILSELIPKIHRIFSADYEPIITDLYDMDLLLFLNTPKSCQAAEQQLQDILQTIYPLDCEATLVRCSNLENTAAVRKAFLCHQEYLEDVKVIFPQKKLFYYGELEFARECRQLIAQGEAAVNSSLHLLSPLYTKGEDTDLIHTLAVYLLDGNSNVAETAQLLYLHKNTVKYRLLRITALLGYRPNKMPESIKIYQAAAIYRLNL